MKPRTYGQRDRPQESREKGRQTGWQIVLEEGTAVAKAKGPERENGPSAEYSEQSDLPKDR
jgi:hypothetical protein